MTTTMSPLRRIRDARRITLHTRLDRHAAIRTIARGVTGRRPTYPAEAFTLGGELPPGIPPTPVTIVGTVRTDRLELTVNRPDRRSVWRCVLTARITSEPGGAELTGRFHWHPASILATVAMLAIPGFATLVVASRIAHGTLTYRPPMLILPGMLLAALGMIAVGVRWMRDDEQYLRTWLATRLRPRR
ncbi:hypothetical protein [Actinocatenispora rupis]|nr:hypothetical protein [Actinocatenispora rupis]